MGMRRTVRDYMSLGVLYCVFAEVPLTCQTVSLHRGPGDVYTAIEGETVVLPCILKHLNVLSFVSWARHAADELINLNSVIRIDSERSRYRILGDVSDSDPSLQITDVRVTDSGTYICGVYRDIIFTRRTDLANGTLRVLPNYKNRNSSAVPLCTSAPTRATVGHRVNLTCFLPRGDDGIGPRPELAWYKKSQDGFLNPLKDPENRDQAVFQRVLIPEDNGVNFICKVQYPDLGALGLTVGGECSVMPLRVLPTVSIDPSGVLKVARNSDIIFRCNGYGVPGVTGYNWRLRPELPAQRYEILENGTFLRIKKTQPEDDSTNVTCVVRTESGLTGEASTVLKFVVNKNNTGASTSLAVNVNLVTAVASSLAAGIVFLLAVMVCIFVRKRTKNPNLRTSAETDQQGNSANMAERPVVSGASGRFATDGTVSLLSARIAHYDSPSPTPQGRSGNYKELDSRVPQQPYYVDLSSKTQHAKCRDVSLRNEYCDYVGPEPANGSRCEDDDADDYETYEIHA